MSDQSRQRLTTRCAAAALLRRGWRWLRLRAPTPPRRLATRRSISSASPIRCRASRRKLASGEPITIVAIGSSSTAGAGASSPAANYPSRLAGRAHAAFPEASRFTVLNRGVNGEEVADMLRRFDTAVVAEKPDLVLWQLGTNSVIRDHHVRRPRRVDPRRLDKITRASAPTSC